MIVVRFFIIILKLTVCLSFKKYTFIRTILFPVHLICLPHFLFMNYHKRIRTAFESLGVVFIKLGQSLSLKSFLFNKQTLKSLSYLQDGISPMEVDVAKYIMNLNPLLNSIEVDLVPIASASIAQVHRGFVNDEVVAIKILRKDIARQVDKDFKIVFFCAKIINKFCSPALQILDIANDIYCNLQQEINFLIEAQNLQTVKRNLALDKNIHIPSVFLEYSNKNSLVMSFVDGVSLREVIHGNTAINKKEVATNILNTYLNQVYRDGVFHADMHSGNIMVKSDSSIALLDFGLISRISRKDRRAVATMIYAFLHGNYNLVVRTQFNAGYISQAIYFNEGYRLAMKKLANRFQGKFEMSSFTSELFLIMNQFEIFIPKHLLMLNKTIMYVEDLVKQLDSQFEPFRVMSPWIKHWYYKEQTIMFFEKNAKLLVHIRNNFYNPSSR